MKKIYTLVLAVLMSFASHAQWFPTNLEVDTTWLPTEVVVPSSQLTYQVVFVGGFDVVQTTPTYGNPAGQAVAKQWHDFIGFTPDNTGNSLGWVSVNHEMVVPDTTGRIGDCGGMTVFQVDYNNSGDSLVVLNQTLSDGRTGRFFNVDFVNTVGTTGMNCGGITSIVDGRIWTAEEWFRTGNDRIGDRDTADFVIGTGTPSNPAPAGFPGYNGETIKKFENYNWMVEIDPREAVAVRKQYNWGRQGFEGGCVLPDNRTVFLGEDGTPGWFTKFVADNAGDFTSGKTYVYKHDNGGSPWVEIDNSDFQNMLNYKASAVAAQATMYNRIEWVALDTIGNKVYFTETGRDNPGGRWKDEFEAGAVVAPHHGVRAANQGTQDTSSTYEDFYGRVMVYDIATEVVSVHLEGGPDIESDSTVGVGGTYPYYHLSNPDGIATAYIQGNAYLIIQEDLNGTSMGRMPSDIGNRTCEVYLLPANISNPTWNDLRRIAIVPLGAEATGAVATPDGNTIMINSQHPSTSNPFPYNNSLTFALTGWNSVISDLEDFEFDSDEAFAIHPNPTTRELFLNKTTDVAIYNLKGERVSVIRNTNRIDLLGLEPGAYFIRNAEGQTKKFIIE